MADLCVIHDKSFEHQVEVLTATADVFKLALRELNTLEEKRELFASLDRMLGATRSSKVQVRAIWHQISSHPAELEAA